jgi:hypothetical protein
MEKYNTKNKYNDKIFNLSLRSSFPRIAHCQSLVPNRHYQSLHPYQFRPRFREASIQPANPVLHLSILFIHQDRLPTFRAPWKEEKTRRDTQEKHQEEWKEEYVLPRRLAPLKVR